MGCAFSTAVLKYDDAAQEDRQVDSFQDMKANCSQEIFVHTAQCSPPHKRSKMDGDMCCANGGDKVVAMDSESHISPQGLPEVDSISSSAERVEVDRSVYPKQLGPLRPENGSEFDPKGAPIPNNENFRIQVLQSYNLLDTEAEPRFDRLTSLAAMIFKAPVALVSLVDSKRQWFKSNVGLACSETSRETSFCAFTLLPSKDPCLVVPDATKDTRFALNPLVTGEPYIRFYAGAPLVTQSSYILGSLCVIDFVPRTFSAQEKELLVALAQLVVMEVEKHSKALEMQRLQAERFEEDKKGLLQAIDAFSEGLVLCNVVQAGQPIVFVNEGWERITGFSIKEAIGMHCGSLLQGPGTDHAAVKLLAKACKRGTEASVEILNYKKDGTPFWNWLRIRPVTFPKGMGLPDLPDMGGPNGSGHYYFGIMSDCTVRKEKELELEHIRVREIEAEAATRAKRQFVANISHEIRTPMNAIIACSQLLQDSSLTEDQRELAQMINGSGQQLLSLINDILDFSKMDAGKMGLSPKEFNVWTAIDFCMDMLVLKCENKGLDLSFNMNYNVPTWIWADEVRLRQIIANLLSNAAKFTNEGGEVELSVAAKLIRRRTGSILPRPTAPSAPQAPLAHLDTPKTAPSSPKEDGTSANVAMKRSQGWLEKISQHPGAWLPQYELIFSVRDTGIGIPKDFQNVLFEAFTQCDNSRTRRYEGTGLGLAISKELAECMGGRMWVESEEGKGSTFYFSIIANGSPHETTGVAPPGFTPLLNGPSPLLPNPLLDHPSTPVTGKRALLVGQRGTFQRMVRSMLRSWGVECDPAVSVAEFRERCFTETPEGPEEGQRRRSSMDRRPDIDRNLHRRYDLVVADCPMAAPPVLGDESQVERLVLQHEQALELMQMGVSCSHQVPTILLMAKYTKGQVAFDSKLLEKVTVASRPVRVNQLYTTVLRLLVRHTPRSFPPIPRKPSRQAAASNEGPDPLRILVAEDNIINQRVLLKLLKGLKYDHVATAMNGIEVLEHLKQDPVDLILMDVQMPVMDGMVATSRVRADFPASEQPIIVALTADVGPGIEEECRQAGMGGYLSKPVKKAELENLLAKCIELKRNLKGRRNSLWLDIS